MSLIKIDKFVGGWHSPNVTSNVQIDPSDATDILNVEYYPRGSIGKREGYLSYTMSSTPITGVMKLFPWKDNTGSNVSLAYTCTSGASVSAEVYTLSLANDVITTSRVFSAEKYGSAQWSPTMSASEVHVASYGGSAIAVAGGAGPPLSYYNSSPASAVPESTAPSGAKQVAAWGNYLFLGNLLVSGTRKYSRVQWNSGGDVGSWPATYYIDLDPDDGDEITGMSLMGDYLVVFKKHKIFIVYWVGGTLLFKEARRSATVGCISGNTIVEFNNKLYFLGDDGFYWFDGTNTHEISKKIKDKVLEIDQEYPNLHNAGIYEAHRQIWFAVDYEPLDHSLEDYQKQPNRVFVYDWELENWTQYDIPITAMSYLTVGSDRLISELTQAYNTYSQSIGSFAGAYTPKFVLGHANYLDSTRKSCLSRFGGTSSDISSTAINSYWIGPWYDLQEPGVNKRLTRTTILADQESTETDHTIAAEIHEDWKNSTYLLADGTASSWTIHLTGYSSPQHGETSEAARDGLPMETRIDTTRTLRSWRIKLSNNTAANSWKVHKIIFDGIVKGKTKAA